MNNNIVHNKLQKFAIPIIDIGEFQYMLEKTKSYNPIQIWWEKLDGDKTNREMYWGVYKGGAASQTRSAEDLVALVSITDGREYRTIDYSSVWKCRFEDKTYYVN